MKFVKPYMIVEKGKDKPFVWNNKEMTFINRSSAKDIMSCIEKDFSYLDLEIKEVYNKKLKKILGRLNSPLDKAKKLKEIKNKNIKIRVF